MKAFLEMVSEDPIGLTEPHRPTATERLRLELTTLRAGVRGVIEANQGLPAARVSDSAGLVECLQECVQDMKDEAENVQRDLRSLQHTVGLLQAERRKSQPAAPTTQQPPTDLQAHEPAANEPEVHGVGQTSEAVSAVGNGLERRADTTSSSAAAAAVAAAAADAAVAASTAAAIDGARREEQAAAAAALAAAEVRAATRQEYEKEMARSRTVSALHDLEERCEAERAAISACMSAAVAEVEATLRATAESHRLALQATRQRAAQMLARKDAALSAARARTEPANSPAVGSAAPAAAAKAGGGGEAANGAVSSRSIGVGTEDGISTAAQRLLAAVEAGTASSSDLATSFARRVAELEGALSKAREANASLEGTQADDQRKRRVLRARVVRQEKRGGADVEYLRNVLLRWFTLPPADRGALFPVISAACGFTATELGEIERARASQASGGSWWWPRAAETPEAHLASDRRPPGTPLAPTPKQPTARGAFTTPAACGSSTAQKPSGAETAPREGRACSGAQAEEVAALHEKVGKLRWLLQCAHAEISKLREAEQREQRTP